MRNFIFISPNFPTNFWQFCRSLANNGINVLGIGDQPYDELPGSLTGALKEYYKVDSLENYDEVYRGAAFFAFKYGRIEWIESNNEYWLSQDARLRDDFNVRTGFGTGDMDRVKYKSGMKACYEAAGIPAARWHLVDDEDGCREFIKQVGYPVIVKPDCGVGAADTHRIDSDAGLSDFLDKKPDGMPYIMEEFVDGTINSYDAIINSKGEPVFETGNVTLCDIMDSVNEGDEAVFYIQKELPDDTRKYGRAAVKAFGVKSRFVHFEFFRLNDDHSGLGKKGELIGLEVNMRPCGGYGPEMMNYANSIDVYKVWADMVAYDGTELRPGKRCFCAYAGLRDGRKYRLSADDINAKYWNNIRMHARLSEALSGAMGNEFYIAVFDEKEEMDSFLRDVLEREVEE